MTANSTDTARTTGRQASSLVPVYRAERAYTVTVGAMLVLASLLGLASLLAA